MRTLLKILLLSLICFSVKAQSPYGFPSPNNPRGYYNIGWLRSDSGSIIGPNSPTFTPLFYGTEITYLNSGVDTSLWIWIGRWVKELKTGDAGTFIGVSPIVVRGDSVSCPTCGSGSGGISQLTGDGTAGPGSGSQPFTLATVNTNVGSFGDASHVATFTANGKGLITVAGQTSILIAESQVTNLITDLAGKQPMITTGSTSQYFKGDLSLATFPTNLSSFTNGPGYITGISGITAGGALTGTYPNPSLASTITAGSCINCNLSFNAAGQLTVAANGSSGGTQNLTYAQFALNNTLSISAGNTQTFLTATPSLSGLMDTSRVKTVDSLHNRTYTNFISLTTTGTTIFSGLTSSGANDSVLTVDPITGQVHRRSGTFNVGAVSGISVYGTTNDSFALGNTALLQNTTIPTSGFTFSITGLPNKSTALGTDSVLIENAGGQMFKLPVPSGGGSFSGPLGSVVMTDPTTGLLTTLPIVVGQPVRLATVVALPSNTYNNGAGTLTATANGLLPIDGVNVATGDSVLIKNEATPSHNGPYRVTQPGSGGTPYILTRLPYASIPQNLVAMTSVGVQAGNTQTNQVFYQTTATAITIGTTSLVYAREPLPQAGIGAGSCTNCTLTLDGQGRVTNYSTGTGGGVNTVKRTFTLTSHGFTVDEPLYINGSGVPTPADTINFATMVVDSVINANSFEATMSGTYNHTAHGKTIGSYYYVTMPAGSLTTTSPNKSQYIIYIQDANTIQVINTRPVDFTGAVFGANAIDTTIGDVVANGPGKVPATIQAGAVSLSKMANGSASSLLGYNASAVPSVITLGTGLSMAGTTLNSSGGGGGPTLFTVTSDSLNVLTALANKVIRFGGKGFYLDSINDFKLRGNGGTVFDVNVQGGNPIISGGSQYAFDNTVTTATHFTSGTSSDVSSFGRLNVGDATASGTATFCEPSATGIIFTKVTFQAPAKNGGVTSTNVYLNIPFLGSTGVTNGNLVATGATSTFTGANTAFGQGDLSLTSNGGNLNFGVVAGTTGNLKYFMGGYATGNEVTRLTQTGNWLHKTTTDVASSMETWASTTQGILPPRMTTTNINAISSPATGLLAYDNVLNNYYFYNGSAWTAMGGGSGAVSSVFGRTGAVVATTGDYAVANITGAAPLASPVFTGTPSLPTGTTGVTQTVGDNSTKIATTAFVIANVGTATSGTYTPTFTNTTNISSSALQTANYIRVGNIVEVTIGGTITPTSAASTVLTFTLPVTSTTALQPQTGTGVVQAGSTTTASAGLVGVVTTTTGNFAFLSTTTTSTPFVIKFSYTL